MGNARYPIDGTRLDAVPKGIPPVVPDPANEANLLGGEAAAVGGKRGRAGAGYPSVAARLAVAERLWSAKDVNDIDNMYTRLQAMDSWSTVSAGLQQHTQQQVQFTRLANNADTLPLQILAQALEPA